MLAFQQNKMTSNENTTEKPPKTLYQILEFVAELLQDSRENTLQAVQKNLDLESFDEVSTEITETETETETEAQIEAEANKALTALFVKEQKRLRDKILPILILRIQSQMPACITETIDTLCVNLAQTRHRDILDEIVCFVEKHVRKYSNLYFLKSKKARNNEPRGRGAKKRRLRYV